MANFCSNCGNKLEENQAFCAKCGTPVNASATQAPNQTASSQAPAGSTPSQVTIKVPAQVNDFGKRCMAGFKKIPENVKTDKMVIGALAASAVLLIALFLPFAKISFFGYTESYSFIRTGCGFITLLAVLIGAAFAGMKEWLAATIAGCFSLLFFIIQWIAKDDLLSCGFGFFVMLIAIIAFLVITVLEFVKTKKVK